MKSWLARHVRQCTIGSVGLTALAVVLTAPATVAAQAVERTLVQKSGLHSFYEGHVVRAIVTEVGPRAATALVRIDFRDHTDRVLARTEARLLRGEPVILDWKVTRSQRPVLVRATVTVITTGGETSTPMTVLEDVDPLSLTIGTRVVCNAGPPSGRDSAQTLFICPGWNVSWLTTTP